jgi:TRAM domain
MIIDTERNSEPKNRSMSSRIFAALIVSISMLSATGRNGDGIARIQGFVIFVKNGRIGQDVKAKVTTRSG